MCWDTALWSLSLKSLCDRRVKLYFLQETKVCVCVCVSLWHVCDYYIMWLWCVCGMCIWCVWLWYVCTDGVYVCGWYVWHMYMVDVCGTCVWLWYICTYGVVYVCVWYVWHMYMAGVCGRCICVCCVHAWRLKVDAECLSLLLPTLFCETRFPCSLDYPRAH